ncbi:MAG: hypothetical protein MUP81_00600 [Dehalococcoidia bacterium]|nr:hypothetical protein [Dehalococcoidia bacterium]
MARVIGPLLSITARGLVGSRLTFSKKKTGQQVRFQKSNVDLNSFDQQRNRDVYKDAVAEWNLLSTAEKEVWKAQAVGLELTGFNLFIKDYYMNTIRKLATVENIDFKVLGDTLIYTVPTGTKLIVTGLVARAKTLDAQIGDGSAVLKRGSDDATILSFPSLELGGVGNCAHYVITYTAHGIQPIITAGDTVEIEITVADTGTALTFDVDLIGYLLEV